MRTACGRPRRGQTLAELVAVLAVMAVLVAIAAPRLGHARDQTAVRGAALEVRLAFQAARQLAYLRGERVAVRVDTAGGAVAVHAGADTLRRHGLARAWGVRVAATRDSMAYAPPGVGYGGANLRVVVARGAAADTVVVSRVGRVR